MTYKVYVLRSLRNNRYYTGSTIDLDRRLAEHNTGKSPYDRLNCPFELLYFEEYASRQEAVRREKLLKTGKGRERILRIIDRNA